VGGQPYGKTSRTKRDESMPLSRNIVAKI